MDYELALGYWQAELNRADGLRKVLRSPRLGVVRGYLPARELESLSTLVRADYQGEVLAEDPHPGDPVPVKLTMSGLSVRSACWWTCSGSGLLLHRSDPLPHPDLPGLFRHLLRGRRLRAAAHRGGAAFAPQIQVPGKPQGVLHPFLVLRDQHGDLRGPHRDLAQRPERPQVPRGEQFPPEIKEFFPYFDRLATRCSAWLSRSALGS